MIIKSLFSLSYPWIQKLDRDLRFISENPVDSNDWIVISWPSRLEAANYKDPKVIASELPQKWKPAVQDGVQQWSGVGPNTSALHFQNFERCVRDRKQPVEDVFGGQSAAAVAHMINLSATRKKFVLWDRVDDRLRA